MQMLIVGAGALGCFFAALLARSGNDVCLLVRNQEEADVLGARGLIVGCGGEQLHTRSVRVIAGIEHAGRADVIMFMVKSYHTADALRQVLPAVGETTALLTLQNGIGNIECLADAVPGKQILGGTTAQGVTKLGSGVVRHAGAGGTVIGCLHPAGMSRAHQVRKAFTRAGIDTSITDNLMGAIWTKLVVNCGINALAAIMNCSNSGIAHTPEVRALMAQAAQEAARVASAGGIELLCDDPAAMTERVCRATAANICSTLQDLRMGRRTEIDAINGAVVREGRRRGVATPVNALLADLVACLEEIGLHDSIKT
jgi:2-dehydropantoate 2-reductase